MLHAKLARQCTCMQCTACCARLPATLVLTCLHILPPALWASKTICPTRQNQNPSLKHRTRCGHLSLVGLSPWAPARTQSQCPSGQHPGPGWRRHSCHGCCCFAHAAAETMLLTRHRSCHISNWPLFRPRPASRGRTNTNQTKQCADRFDQCSEQMSARKDVPRMFDSIGANTHESKLRLFSRPPLPHSFAQALLRAQEATSSHFERNLARFGLTHVQQCGLHCASTHRTPAKPTSSQQ